MDFIAKVKQKARELNKRIVFPETFDDRTLKAIEIIVKEQLAQPFLLGKEVDIKAQAEKAGVSIDWSKITFVDPKDPKRQERYAQALFERRKKRDSRLKRPANG